MDEEKTRSKRPSERLAELEARIEAQDAELATLTELVLAREAEGDEAELEPEEERTDIEPREPAPTDPEPEPEAQPEPEPAAPPPARPHRPGIVF